MSLIEEIIESKYKEFIALIEDKKRVVIVGHLNPDGDCIGSTTALKRFITDWHKDICVNIAVPTEYPEFLSFLDPQKEILIYSKEPQKVTDALQEADLIICMDLNKPSRTEKMEEALSQSSAKKILIDHHIDPHPFVDLMISTVNISSTCELTYWLLRKITKEQLSLDILTSLYTGLVTDTNNFSNSVFPSTFLMASQIAETQLDREAIQHKVLNSYSENRMRLMGDMLMNKMQIFDDLHASVMVLDKKTQDDYDFQKGDSEGFVNLPLNIKDISLSALLTEDTEYVRVSLRSKDGVSANNLAKQYFNGGGHERAAGGRIFLPIDKVTEYFENSVRKFFESNKA